MKAMRRSDDPRDRTDVEWTRLDPVIPPAKEERDVLHGPYRMPVASVAPRCFPVVDGVERCPHMAQRWNRGAHADGPAGACASAEGTRSDAQRCHQREPRGATTPHRGVRGDDGGTNVNGRSRPLLGETTGMILSVRVPEADRQDPDGGTRLLALLKSRVPRRQPVWADRASRTGSFVDGVTETLGWEVKPCGAPGSGLRGVWVPKDGVRDGEKIRPSGFPVLTGRGMVERTVAWRSTWRRLSTDDAWMSVAMIPLMVRRLANAALIVTTYTRHARAA